MTPMADRDQWLIVISILCTSVLPAAKAVRDELRRRTRSSSTKACFKQCLFLEVIVDIAWGFFRNWVLILLLLLLLHLPLSLLLLLHLRALVSGICDLVYYIVPLFSRIKKNEHLFFTVSIVFSLTGAEP